MADKKKTAGFLFLVAQVVVAGVLGAMVLAGCGIGTGPTQELTIDEPLGSAAVTDVNVSMGAGHLTIGPGGSGLVSGLVKYNVEKWKPEVTRSDSAVNIKQGTTKGLSGLSTDVVNDWVLKLGAAPLRLSVSAGAYDGSYELGGLSLQKLSIKDGASKSTVSFSAPNPSQMESLVYETGASTVTLTGLGDANFKKMTFKGGAGTFTLDFSGKLRTDGSVSLDAGVGSVHIVVPAGMAVKVIVDSKLTKITQEGTWTVSGKDYTTAAADGGKADKQLTITVNMGVGNLTLTAG
jgi:hypothetical protein